MLQELLTQHIVAKLLQKKEMYAIVFALEKFRPYLLGVKVTVHINHYAIKHLLSKNDSKPRLIRWVLLL